VFGGGSSIKGGDIEKKQCNQQQWASNQTMARRGIIKGGVCSKGSETAARVNRKISG